MGLPWGCPAVAGCCPRLASADTLFAEGRGSSEIPPSGVKSSWELVFVSITGDNKRTAVVAEIAGEVLLFKPLRRSGFGLLLGALGAEALLEAFTELEAAAPMAKDNSSLLSLSFSLSLLLKCTINAVVENGIDNSSSKGKRLLAKADTRFLRAVNWVLLVNTVRTDCL